MDEGSRYDCSRSSRGGQCVALLKCKCGLPATHSWHADIKVSIAHHSSSDYVYEIDQP